MEEKETQELESGVVNWDWLTDYENHVPAISAAKLMERPIEPREYVVRGLLPQGLSILGGAPKIGKSWLVLDLCLHVATGEPFWGMPVSRGTAWYISLEDTQEHIHRRLGTITDQEPDNLFFTTEEDGIGTMADGLEKHMNNFMDQHRDTKLIVIDTFQLARGNSKEPSYAGDYADIQKFKHFADKRKVAILLVHHLRKMGDADPVNKLSGTTGIGGGVDSTFIMDRSRKEDVAQLFCTGRSIQPRELELRFDRTACVWNMVSDSLEGEERQLPHEMRMLLEFMQETSYFLGSNTELAERMNRRCQLSHIAKVWKQMMNRWSFLLQDHGLTFRDHRSNGQRFVEIIYTPPVTEGTQVTQSLGGTEDASLAPLATL